MDVAVAASNAPDGVVDGDALETPDTVEEGLEVVMGEATIFDSITENETTGVVVGELVAKNGTEGEGVGDLNWPVSTEANGDELRTCGIVMAGDSDDVI